jgi:hypothetical protein
MNILFNFKVKEIYYIVQINTTENSLLLTDECF